MSTQTHAVEFTPRAYATQWDGTERGFEFIKTWAAERGLHSSAVELKPHQGFITVHPDAPVNTAKQTMELSKFDWLVVYAGELTVLTDRKYRLFSTGTAL